MTSVHPRYIPRDASEVQRIASSIQVIRTSDSSSFLATKIPDVETRDAGQKTETTNLVSVVLPVAAISISRILNHPNIISLVDIVKTSEEAGRTSESGPHSDITVWEDMDAGSLAYLLPSPSTWPAFDDQVGWHNLAAQNYQRFSLPESICWHVLRSVTRALLWLHHGVKETEGISGEWLPHDEDWHAILIMDVSPGQIWFKKPKGEETYGECKLGGFQWARLCGSVNARVAMAHRIENAPLAKQYFWAPEIYKETQPYTRASEIWALGATIYTMMTGAPPPRFYEYNWQISRMTDKGYTSGIRTIVADMLKPHPLDRPSAMQLLNRADDAWEGWRATTEEGAHHCSILDKELERAALGTTGALIL